MHLELMLANRLISVLEDYTPSKEGSQCFRRLVKCVIWDRDTGLMAPGVNGPTVTKFKCSNQMGSCGCGHAEQRAVITALRRGFKSGKSILISSYSPCTNCANLLIVSGLLKGAVYQDLMNHDPRGVDLLNRTIPVLTIAQLGDFIGNQREGSVYDVLGQWKC